QKAGQRLDKLVRRARGSGVAPGEVRPEDLARFVDAVDDDFDTPAAIAVVFEAARDANIAFDEGRPADGVRLVAAVRTMCDALGAGARCSSSCVPAGARSVRSACRARSVTIPSSTRSARVPAPRYRS